jgi:rhamnogalacturonyl hydrolase YesR
MFYEKTNDKTQLEIALKWALKSAEITDNGQNNYSASRLYFKLKNKIKAKEYALKAIEKAKEMEDNYKETEELLAQIEKM